MIYYHGTNVLFDNYNISYSGSYKDFGKGFYLSEKESHARSVALWKGGLHAYVYKYSCKLSDLRSLFNVKEFKSASIDWIKFIILNRVSIIDYGYDIIIGPTADADSQKLVSKFVSTYGTDFDTIPVDKLKELQFKLKIHIYPNQICLKSQGAIDYFNSRRVNKICVK